MRPKLVQVQFLNAPVPLMFKANQHQQELMREFALIQLSDDSAKQGRSRPGCSRWSIDTAGSSRRCRSGAPTSLQKRSTRGDAHSTWRSTCPRLPGPAALEMLTTLAEADEFCRRGELLTLATPPEYVAFREWFFGEIVRQLDGKPPTPWRTTSAASP